MENAGARILAPTLVAWAANFVGGGARRRRGAGAEVCWRVRRTWGLGRALCSEHARSAPALVAWRADVTCARLEVSSRSVVMDGAGGGGGAEVSGLSVD